MNKTVLYMGIFIVGFIGVSLFSFWLTVRPPEAPSSRTPSDYEMPSEEVSFQAKDGTDLSAWLISSEQSPKRALILLHGYPASKSHMLPLAKRLYPDFTLLLPDLRSFGDSGGSFTTLGVKERGDLSAAIDELEARGYEEIGVHGFSLGGAVALSTAAEDKRIDAVSSLSSFSDLRTLGYQTYSHLFVLKYPLVELMNLWGSVLFGSSLAGASPINVAKDIEAPVLISHGRADDQIPFSHAKEIEKALSGRTATTATAFFEDGEHGRVPPKFGKLLRTFFNDYLNK